MNDEETEMLVEYLWRYYIYFLIIIMEQLRLYWFIHNILQFLNFQINIYF